jgi:hypothetical protein
MAISILHADHGLTEAQLSFVRTHLEEVAPPHFFILQIEIPAELGPVPNAMKGPVCGDPPVEDGPGVFDRKRGDRPWLDRMTFGEFRPCNYVQAIGTQEGEDITVFTVYGGPLAPQHPDDPTNADPEASRVFWADHALLTGYTLEHSLAAELTAHMREE